MRFQASVIALVALSQASVASAFVLPRGQVSPGRCQATADDLPDIVKAYQKVHPSGDAYSNLELVAKSASATRDVSVASAPRIPGGADYFQSTRENWLNRASLPSNSDDSFQESLQALRASVKSLQSDLNAARESLGDGIEESSSRVAKATAATSSHVLQDSHQALQSSVESLRQSLLHAQTNIQEAKGTVADIKALPLTDYIKEQLHASSGLATSVDTAAVQDFVKTSSDQIHQSVDSMQKAMTIDTTAVNDLIQSSGEQWNQGVESMQKAMTIDTTAVKDFVQSSGDQWQQGVASMQKAMTIDTGAVNDFFKASVGQWHQGVESMQQAAKMTTAGVEQTRLVQRVVNDLAHSTTAANSEAWLAAKMKMSIMMSNTYELFGMKSPDGWDQSGFVVTPASSMVLAFLAFMLASGAQQYSQDVSERRLEYISQQHNHEIHELQLKMASMTAEIQDLNTEVGTLQLEIKKTNQRIERKEFRYGLERGFKSGKLRALRRRVQRMQRSVIKKEHTAAQLEWQVLETKTWNIAALAVLTEVDTTIRNQLTNRHEESSLEHAEKPRPFFVNPLVRSQEPAYIPSFAFQILQM